MTDLLLWRHADEAEQGDDRHELRRALTVRGEKQAKSMARWIRAEAPKHLRVLSSPALYARQTAKALDLPCEIEARLGPKAAASDLLAAAGWPDGTGKRHGAVLLVGHQPALGRLAALLLAGGEDAWSIKKGSLWWFTNRVREGETQTILRAVMSADLAGGG
ncbi:MAG: histidine phosphatase family protein [Betaproteobacteria bacterium]|nr:histidine phosphatase family protein [Betaproteobacteria bacterium]